ERYGLDHLCCASHGCGPECKVLPKLEKLGVDKEQLLTVEQYKPSASRVRFNRRALATTQESRQLPHTWRYFIRVLEVDNLVSDDRHVSPVHHPGKVGRLQLHIRPQQFDLDSVGIVWVSPCVRR